MLTEVREAEGETPGCPRPTRTPHSHVRTFCHRRAGLDQTLTAVIMGTEIAVLRASARIVRLSVTTAIGGNSGTATAAAVGKMGTAPSLAPRVSESAWEGCQALQFAVQGIRAVSASRSKQSKLLNLTVLLRNFHQCIECKLCLYRDRITGGSGHQRILYKLKIVEAPLWRPSSNSRI